MSRLGRLSGIWLDFPLDRKTRACWAIQEQTERFSCMGSPATSPPLCPRWLLVGRHMDPDVRHWRQKLRYLVVEVCHKNVYLKMVPPVTYCLEDTWKEETILFELCGLAWIGCLLPHLDSLECVKLESNLFAGHQVRILHRKAHKGSSPSPLPCLYRQQLWCCLWL